MSSRHAHDNLTALQGSATLLSVVAMAIPLTLLWDFSWESTVGRDSVWAAPHLAGYIAVFLTAIVALAQMRSRVSETEREIRLGPWQAPLGAWLVLWGAVAFVIAVPFDRWWQINYGLEAGIWHPAQVLKALAFVSILGGTWIAAARSQNELCQQNAAPWRMHTAGAAVLILSMVVSLPLLYPNRQHGTFFYLVGCAVYPCLLTALAAGSTAQWPATMASLLALTLWVGMVWILPLIPAQQEVVPIYNPRDTLLPPPFPLMLCIPALGIDAALRWFPWPEFRGRTCVQVLAIGTLFFILFAMIQWSLAEFLLSPVADNRFFAGGGRHWPFFLKIDPAARVSFWHLPHEELNLRSGLIALALATASAAAGLVLGRWIIRIRR